MTASIELLPADYASITKLASEGTTLRHIAQAVGMGWTTFRERRHKDDRLEAAYQKGRAELHNKLVSKLVEQAIGGNTACLIFACKCLLGLTEQGPDDVGPTVAVSINLPSAMTPKQYSSLVTVAAKGLPEGGER